MDYDNDYRFSKEAQERDLRIVYKCPDCGHEYEDYPGVNEETECICGGRHQRIGESYLG